MKHRYEPDGVLQLTRTVVEMLTDPNEVSEQRWKWVDDAIRDGAGYGPRAEQKEVKG